MFYSIHRYKRITSTNNVAKSLAEEGAPEGTVVIAESQSEGRGRLGRIWVSPPRDGLYLSIVLKPAIPIAEMWQIGYVAAVAVAEAINEISELDARVKWPNDIIVNGRKVAGILVEVDNCGGTHEPAVIIGIGININMKEFPEDVADKATSLAIECSKEFDVDNMESCLLSSMHKWYSIYQDEGFDPIFNRLLELDCVIGQQVTIQTPNGVVTGKAISINKDGNLIVQSEDGQEIAIFAGDTILQD